MKKWFATVLVLVMALSSFAVPGFAEEEKITIGWAVAYFDHPVYQVMMQGAQELADSLENCEVIFADGKNDANTQASQIDTFIAQGVDAIILTAAGGETGL